MWAWGKVWTPRARFRLQGKDLNFKGKIWTNDDGQITIQWMVEREEQRNRWYIPTCRITGHPPLGSRWPKRGKRGRMQLEAPKRKKNSFILESFWSSYLISSILKKVNFKPFSPNEGFQKRDIIKKVFHLDSFWWTRSDKHDSRSDQLGSFVLYTLCEWAKAMS